MAYSYVAERISLDEAVGFEKEWDCQLSFFSITRLPVLLAGLGLALWLEAKLTMRHARSRLSGKKADAQRSTSDV